MSHARPLTFADLMSIQTHLAPTCDTPSKWPDAILQKVAEAAPRMNQQQLWKSVYMSIWGSRVLQYPAQSHCAPGNLTPVGIMYDVGRLSNPDTRHLLQLIERNALIWNPPANLPPERLLPFCI